MNNQRFDPEGLSPADWVMVVAVRNKHVAEAARQVSLTVVTLLAACPALVFVLCIDFVVAWIIYEALWPPMPGEDNSSTITALAMTACVMVVACHLRIDDESNTLGRHIKRLVDCVLPVYLIGSWVLLGALLYVNGGSTLLTTVDVSSLYTESADWLNDTAQDSEGPLAGFLTKLHAWLPLLFCFGGGGLAVVSVFVATALLGKIKGQTEGSFALAHKAREATSLLNDMQAAHARCTTHANECNRLMAIPDQTIALQTAVACATPIAEALAVGERYLTDRLEVNNTRLPPMPNAAPHVDQEALRKRLDTLRSIDIPMILSFINNARPENHDDDDTHA